MALLDAKEILDFVMSKWNKSLAISPYVCTHTNLCTGVCDTWAETGDLKLVLDEYDPRVPNYQIVFINRPARTFFVSPNVVKHEQDVVLEVHVKLKHYEPTDLLTQREEEFKIIKGELSRIFNTYRYDNVGNILNMSSWVDAKLPHGLGDDREPIEFISRLTVEISYYESIDDSLVGIRVASVNIMGTDLLGLIDCKWEDTNPWVEIQVPKGMIIEQHLLGPQINIEVSTHDYESLHTALYTIPITGIIYPINVDNTKAEFSTDIPDTPQFIVTMKDNEGTSRVFNFFNVKVKTIELSKSTSSGKEELIWVVKLMADYVYTEIPE